MHTKMFARTQILVFSLSALCVLRGEFPGQNFRTLHDGVEYAQVDHKLGSEPVKINLLRLDLKKVRLDVHHALDRAIGLETTSSIAKRKGAVAAINAGFFRLDKSAWAGDAAGILQIDKELMSESHQHRIALGIVNEKGETLVDFAHLQSQLTLFMGIDGTFPIAGVNRERKENELILFTPSFGATTLTNDEGDEYLVKPCNASNPGAGSVISIHEKKGNTSIPPDGCVLSAHGNAQKNLTYFFKELMTLVRWNKKFDIEKEQFFHSADDITNGVPQLIKNGKIDITWEQEKASRSFAETRHPRTAVAKLKDGRFLMITVDGRQPGVSVGMTLQELAEYLLSLGAVNAMNLDGGGSTTMFLDGKVVNTPSDKEGERKIGDAILVTLRKKSATKR